MAKLNKDDLVQMNKNYFQSLTKQSLVEVATNLHQLAVEQCERLEQNSSNSSRPPSTDNPYHSKNKKKEDEDISSKLNNKSEEKEEKESPQTKNQTSAPEGKKSTNEDEQKRKSGKQLGGKGFGRKKPLVVEDVIPHLPNHCTACNQKLTAKKSKPYMGY